MRKIDEIMKDLGFKPGASEEVTKAFIKNLIKQAYGVEVRDQTFPKPESKKDKVSDFLSAQRKLQNHKLTDTKPAEEQLSFNLGPEFSPKKPA